ncbi:MAG TPA: MFS transporter [Bacteroidales bacterium]|nr:MFS transporter [Bacteroidales bacterium]HPI86658.1 MFS transporter [Bacteroidales bacterium]HPM91705.1 MFS transporter [Bacteroidales bacterium]
MNLELKKTAIRLILLFGIISLLGDIIYEGARGVNGPYLQTLGASAAIVGLVAGVGELLGYLIRLVSGYFSDKTKAHWFFTIFGYSFLMVIPLLSLTGVWQFAAIFMVLERIGKGIRNPAKDTILSQATKQVGTGFGFAIVEFLDQIGATLGPLIFTFFFMSIGPGERSVADYQQGYSLLWFPFVVLIMVLFTAFFMVRNPEELEKAVVKNPLPDKITRTFWLYCIFTFVTTLGFLNFAIIGYHLKANNIVTDAQIPLMYALAMGVDAIIGLIIGKWYDRLKSKHKNDHAGLLLLIALPLMTAPIPLLSLSPGLPFIITGVILWGIVMGTHETIMKAGIADITSIRKRGTGYGIFNMLYGIAIFIGSAAAGFLYDYSINLLITLMIIVEMAALPVFFILRKHLLN